MKRTFVPIVFLATTASVFAQSTPSVRIRIGYGFTPSFRAAGTNQGVEGPEIGVALPIGSAFGQDLYMEPSFYGGGRLRKGSDRDTDIYRLTFFARRTLSKGVGIRAGVGYSSSAHARGGHFDGTNGAIFDLGIDVPIVIKKMSKIGLFGDAHAVIGTQQRLSGFFVGIGAKL